MRKKNGFTLVELLSTIVILGIVVSVTVYIVMKNINKAKEDAELITYNNIKSAAKVYNDEVASYWNTKDNYEYSCISLGNMIEIGYFDEKVIDENDKFSKGTMIKVIRDKDSKVIKETSFSFEDSILPDVDCGYQSSISISTDNKGKNVNMTNAKILYNTLGSDYYRYFYISGFSENTVSTSDTVYTCDGIGSCSNNTVNNLESGHWYLTNSDVVRLSVKSNGSISAFINYSGENVADATKNIGFIDNTPPVINLSIYKIGSYDGNTPSGKGELITNTSSNYIDNEWKNYGYWFDISTNEDTVIKWTYNSEGGVNGGSPSNSGANCNNACSKTLSGDGNRKAIIEAIDEAGNSSKIEIDIYIDRTAPTINVSEQRCSNKDSCLSSLIGNKIEKSTNTNSFIDDKNWSYNGFNIGYNVSDNMSDIKEIRILQNSSSIYDRLSTDIVSNYIVSNNGNITISDTGQRYIQVVAYDNVGNSSVINITGYISNVITINYNANGGSGAPASQNKYNTIDLTLSSTKPVRTGYTFVNWNTKSDGSGTSYSAGSIYSLNETITLYAIWEISDRTPPTCTLSVNSSTITATASDDHAISYQGWNSSYTGDNSTSRNIGIGTHTYYVKDTAGKTNSCSVTIIETTKGSYEDCGNYSSDSGGCYYYSSADTWRHYTGTYYCKPNSGSGNLVSHNCSTAEGPEGVYCPRGYTVVNWCSWVTDYYCTSGSLVNKSCKIYTPGTTVNTYTCPSDYTKLNDSYCYKK